MKINEITLDQVLKQQEKQFARSAEAMRKQQERENDPAYKAKMAAGQEAQREKSMAWKAGWKDGSEGRPAQNASDVYGPYSGSYSSGYQAGKEHAESNDGGSGWAKNVEDEGKRRMAQHTAPLRKESTNDKEFNDLAGTKIDTRYGIGNFEKILPNGKALYRVYDNGDYKYFRVDPDSDKILGRKK